MEPLTTQLLQLAVQGVSIGAIYSLVALGLVLGYKATEVLNFVHGDALLLSAFLGWWLIVGLGLSFWITFPLVVIAVAAICHLLKARVMRVIVGRPQFAGVMLTIGIGFIIRGGVSIVFGPESRSYPTPWADHTTRLFGAVVGDLSLVILAAALGVAAMLFVFLHRIVQFLRYMSKRSAAFFKCVSAASEAASVFPALMASKIA